MASFLGNWPPICTVDVSYALGAEKRQESQKRQGGGSALIGFIYVAEYEQHMGRLKIWDMTWPKANTMCDSICKSAILAGARFLQKS